MLSPPHPPVLTRHFAKAGKPQHLHRFAKVGQGAGISLAAEGQQSVGACLDAAVDPAREMHSEEWKTRIWNRVDERFHQVAPLLRAVARRHRVVGMDLVEVAPSFDAANGVTCVTAGRLILNVLAASWGPDGARPEAIL